MILDGQRALVTGGGTGVGASIALALAEAGAGVTIVGRSAEPLESVAAQSPRIDWAPCDVTRPESVQQVVERSDGFDIAIANAGIAESHPFSTLNPADLQKLLDVNLFGVLNTWQAVLPAMKESGTGRLLAIASIAGLKGYAYVSGYCASKHAVVGMTRALAQELADTRITVNAVCPGYIETPMLEQSIANIMEKTGRTREEAAASLVQHNPQRRFIQPEEVAQSVLWLCRPESASVTGQAISINGGEV